MAEDVIIRYKAEVDEFIKQMNVVIEQQEAVAKEADQSAKSFQKSVNSETFAAKKRAELIAQEKKNIEELQKLRARAFDPAIISRFNQQINAANQRIDVLKNTTKKAGDSIVGAFSSAGTQIKNIGLGIAAGFGAAFSVQAIIDFGKKSVGAFIEAEKNANKLKFAITSIGGESEEAFNRLIKQSEELQKITIFSDDAIQEAQAALSAFGLTADEIEGLLPKLADFATVTGQDITSAAQQVGAGLEGAGREFKKYGIEVSATATRQQNLNSILAGFGKFAGAAESQTKTLSGSMEQLRNEVDNIQESIGQKLAPAFLQLQKLGLRFVEFFANLFGGETQTETERFKEQLLEVGANANLLIETLKRGNLTQEQRNVLIKELNTEYGKYLPNLITEKTTTEELNTIQKELNQNIQDRITLIALEEEITKIIKNTTSAAKDLIKVEQERIKLQSDLSDNAALAATKRDQLNKREAIANAILKDAADRIGALKARYAELSKALGLGETSAKKLSESSEEQRKTFEKINEIIPLTSLAYKDLSEQQLILLKLFEESQKSIGNFRDEVKKLANDLPTVEDAFNEINKGNERLKEFGEKPPFDGLTEGVDGYLDTWIGANERILSDSLALFNELTNITRGFSQQRINDLERQQEALAEANQAEVDGLEESKNKRLISDAEYARRKRELDQKAAEDEKKIQAKINKEKKRQAVLDKAAALFEIALNTSIAVAKVTAQTGIGAPAFIPLIVALGAAQAAAVAAQPIPAYAKGTKGKKGSGMALVGEEGPEMTYLPGGAKVLPAKQTKTYGEVFDAMYDNNFEKYVLKKYVAPALAEQKRKFEERKEGNFASNIVNSMQYNGINVGDLIYANKRGTNIKNTDELAQAIARALKTESPNLRRM